MRILLVNSVFHPQQIGGAEAVVLHLSRAFTARGHAVDVLATTGRRAGRWRLAERTVEGVAGTVREAPFVGLYDLLDDGGRPAPLPVRAVHHTMQARAAAWERLAREALRRARPDVVHTHNLAGLTTAVWRAARREGVPVVHTLHDYQLLCPRTTLLHRRGTLCDAPPLPCRLLARAKLAATAGVDIVTAPARFTLERHLASGAFAGARAVVVRNAPEPPPGPPPDRPDTPARGLFMGQLQVHKGVRELLAATARLLGPDGPPDFALALAGVGPLAGEVAAFCARHGDRCRCLGRVTGAARETAFATAAFLVLPSRWHEVAPLAILEAQGRGLPVVASLRGGIPELVTDGEDGLLVEPEPAPLAAAMARYARDPGLRRRHAAAALRRAAGWTPEQQVEAYLDLYRQAVAGRE
ncbi:MAG: glycosyltransferase [Candidatus Krumholzibacteriia bacterium]